MLRFRVRNCRGPTVALKCRACLFYVLPWPLKPFSELLTFIKGLGNEEIITGTGCALSEMSKECRTVCHYSNKISFFFKGQQLLHGSCALPPQPLHLRPRTCTLFLPLLSFLIPLFRGLHLSNSFLRKRKSNLISGPHLLAVKYLRTCSFPALTVY